VFGRYGYKMELKVNIKQAKLIVTRKEFVDNFEKTRRDGKVVVKED
jgi:hypothetical protein